MRILYLGDIVGEQTIRVLKDHLEEIKKEHHIHLVFCNAENTTKGKGLSFKHYKELKSLGISAMTLGNHAFSKSEIKEFIDDATIARPANFPKASGKEILYVQFNRQTIAIVNLLGRIFLNLSLDCPFATMERLLKQIHADKVIVDFHGEATSEKKAFFYHFAGQVDAILGTHTHIQTADEQVENNTCYITDMGMCGPKDSVLGLDTEKIIERFQTGVYEPVSVAEGKIYQLNGVILDLDQKNHIERFTAEYTL